MLAWNKVSCSAGVRAANSSAVHTVLMVTSVGAAHDIPPWSDRLQAAAPSDCRRLCSTSAIEGSKLTADAGGTAAGDGIVAGQRVGVARSRLSLRSRLSGI